MTANSTVPGWILPNFETIRIFLQLSLLPARMKKIQQKVQKLECSQDFSPL